MIKPLFSHLGHQERRLGDLLESDDQAGIGDPDVQPLAEDRFWISGLALVEVRDREELLPVRCDQRQERGLHVIVMSGDGPMISGG